MEQILVNFYIESSFLLVFGIYEKLKKNLKIPINAKQFFMNFLRFFCEFFNRRYLIATIPPHTNTNANKVPTEII